MGQVAVAVGFHGGMKCLREGGLDRLAFNSPNIALRLLLADEDLQRAVALAREFAVSVADFVQLAREALAAIRQ